MCTHIWIQYGRKLIFKNLACIASRWDQIPPWIKHLLPLLSSPLSVGCLWGQKGQCITKDSPQQPPYSFNEASKRGAPDSLPYDIVLPVMLGHCLRPSPSSPMWKSFCRYGGIFTLQRDVDTFRVVCVQRVSQPDWYGGLQSQQCVCVWRNLYLMCFVCVLCAWAARGSGVTHTIPNSKGVGFLPSRVWLASSSYCYQATLITNSSSPQSSGWLVGWVVWFGEAGGRTEFLCLPEQCTTTAPRRGPELGPDAERGGYEPAGLQGSRGWGHGGAEGPEPEPESGVCGAHSASAASSFAATTGATRIPEA